MASILALAEIIGGDIDQQLTWLQSKGLMPSSKACPACTHTMDMQPRNDITDKSKEWYKHLEVCGNGIFVDGDVQSLPVRSPWLCDLGFFQTVLSQS